MSVGQGSTSGGLELWLGGSVFGWLISQAESWAVLDRFFELGGRRIDTSDGYSSSQRGDRLDSESIIGDWVRRAGVENEVRICTKVGLCPELQGLRLATVEEAVQRSLERLGVPQLEAVLAHADDPELDTVEIAEALSATAHRQEALRIGLSGFHPSRARAVAEASQAQSDVPIELLQEEFSLMRQGFLGSELHQVAGNFGMHLMATGALAQGFLTGKFQGATGRVGHRQKYATERYLDARSHAILQRVHELAAQHGVQMAAVSLAWVASRDVATPVASVTSPEQLDAFTEASRLKLTATEVALLSDGQVPPD
jgi:aryl-alcohol dehydrogenase-like predicted oxidoreductase